MELALCLKHLFGCAVYQCASRRICRIETISLKRGFGPAAVGTSSAWEAGGGSCLCLPPGGGAGLTPLNTPAHHCGGTPMSRRRTGTGREPPSLPGWGQRCRPPSLLPHRAECLRPAPWPRRTAGARGPPGVLKPTPTGTSSAKRLWRRYQL